MALNLQILLVREALATAIPNHITQIRVPKAKKLLKIKVQYYTTHCSWRKTKKKWSQEVEISIGQNKDMGV